MFLLPRPRRELASALVADEATRLAACDGAAAESAPRSTARQRRAAQRGHHAARRARRIFSFLSLAFDVMKTNARRTWHIALGPTDIPHTRRTPAAPARAPPRPGERGVTVWDGDSPSMLSPGSTTQITRGGGPAPKSGSRAPSSPSTALNTSAPSLPTHPLRPGPRRVISGRAISGDLGPRRVTSGDLAQSRAIPELHATPLHPTPPHPPPRRAISGDLGASLARRHTCSKKRKGLVGATGLTRTCSLGSRRLALRHLGR